MDQSRRHLTWFLAVVLIAASQVATSAAERTNAVAIVADLIRPQKLATLRSRGANPRIQKCVYWIEMARRV